MRCDVSAEGEGKKIRERGYFRLSPIHALHAPIALAEEPLCSRVSRLTRSTDLRLDRDVSSSPRDLAICFGDESDNESDNTYNVESHMYANVKYVKRKAGIILFIIKTCYLHCRSRFLSLLIDLPWYTRSRSTVHVSFIIF